jgi:hypothetical protein
MQSSDAVSYRMSLSLRECGGQAFGPGAHTDPLENIAFGALPIVLHFADIMLAKGVGRLHEHERRRRSVEDTAMCVRALVQSLCGDCVPFWWPPQCTCS